MSFFTSASIVNVRLQWKVVVQPGPKYGAGQQLPGAPAYEGRQDVTRIIGNMVLVKSGPHKRNNFWEKLSAIWSRPFRNFACTVLRRKSFKIAFLRGPKFLTCSGRPRVWCQPSVQHWNYVEFIDKTVLDFTDVYCKRLSNMGDVLSLCLSVISLSVYWNNGRVSKMSSDKFASPWVLNTSHMFK